MVGTKRRALGEDAIYFDHRGACRDALKHRQCPGRWLGVVSLGSDVGGKRIRKKVYGRTKTDVKVPAILEFPHCRSPKFPSWLRLQRVVAEVSGWWVW
jgi:hypothetical protein